MSNQEKTTEYKHHIVALCSALIVEKAAQLACIVGEGIADLQSFTKTRWQDANGNAIYIADFNATDDFLGKVGSNVPLVLPTWMQGTTWIGEAEEAEEVPLFDVSIAQEVKDEMQFLQATEFATMIKNGYSFAPGILYVFLGLQKESIFEAFELVKSIAEEKVI